MEKIELKNDNGIKINWDAQGNAFVSMIVNSIPKKQFDDWMKICRIEHSGKRWDMILSDRLKAQAYDALLMTIPEEKEMQDDSDKNPEGLLNGGN